MKNKDLYYWLQMKLRKWESKNYIYLPTCWVDLSCNIFFSLPSAYADETPSETPAPPVEGKEFPSTINEANCVTQRPGMNLNKKS